MRTLPVFFLLMSGLLLFLPCPSHGQGGYYVAQAGKPPQGEKAPKNAPARDEAPPSNMTVIKGTVLKSSVASAGSHCMDSGDVLYLMVISLKETEDVPGFENFLWDAKGRTMAFFTNEKPARELQGKKIKALVTYKGDRTCRLYWVEGIEIIQ